MVIVSPTAKAEVLPRFVHEPAVAEQEIAVAAPFFMTVIVVTFVLAAPKNTRRFLAVQAAGMGIAVIEAASATFAVA
jgi:hypothetical protein